MIYLIESAGIDSNNDLIRLLKIGYTEDSNLDKRMFQYKLHNPTCKVLHTIPGGDLDEESLLHVKFREYKFKDYGNEWFYWNQGIIDYFDTHLDKDSLKELGTIIGYLKTSPRLRKYIKAYTTRVMNYLISKGKLDYVCSLDEEIKSKKALMENTRSFQKIWDYFKDSYGVTKDDLKTYYSGLSKKFSSVRQDVMNFLDHFESLPGYKEKMRLLCESQLTEEEISYILTQIPLMYKTHYIILGPDKLKAQGYNITYVNKLYNDLTKADTKEIDRQIFSTFKVGSRYTKSDIKTTLAEVYRSGGLNRTAKASDLDYYFEMKGCLITVGGKRINGFEILRVKEIEG